MNVRELIAALDALDPDLPGMVDADGDFISVDRVVPSAVTDYPVEGESARDVVVLRPIEDWELKS